MVNTMWIRRETCGHVVMVRETHGGELPDYDARAWTDVRVIVRFPGWPNETRAQAATWVAEHSDTYEVIADPDAKPDTCPTCEGTGSSDNRISCPDCMGTGSTRFSLAAIRSRQS